MSLAMRLAVHLLENFHALVVFLHDDAQTRLHQRVPDRRVVVVGEALRFADGLLDDALQSGVLLLVGVGYTDQQQGGQGGRGLSEPCANAGT